MTRSHTRAITTAVATALALSACRGAPQGPVQTAAQPASGDRAAVAKAKADSARYPYTTADVHFMSGMIAHHAQAIAMARWAPSHGASPSVQTLAERIINAQQDEIGTMQQWLRDRLQPVPEPRATGMKMTMGGDNRDVYGQIHGHPGAFRMDLAAPKDGRMAMMGDMSMIVDSTPTLHAPPSRM